MLLAWWHIIRGMLIWHVIKSTATYCAAQWLSSRETRTTCWMLMWKTHPTFELNMRCGPRVFGKVAWRRFSIERPLSSSTVFGVTNLAAVGLDQPGSSLTEGAKKVTCSRARKPFTFVQHTGITREVNYTSLGITESLHTKVLYSSTLLHTLLSLLSPRSSKHLKNT